MQNERFRLGEFWLDSRKGSPYWYIYWLEKVDKKYRTRKSSTGETDFELAKKKLASKFLLDSDYDEERPADILVAVVLDRDMERHGKKLRSVDTNESAIKKWKAFWGNATIADLGVESKWQRFLDFMRNQTYRGEPLTESTLKRQLNVGRHAIARAYRKKELVSIPYMPNEFEDGEGRERVLLPAEMAKLLNAAIDLEHMWRWMLMAIGTTSRPSAVRELTVRQIDFENKLIRLNPRGRAQTKKRRPMVPICATLLPWLRDWTRKEALVHRGWRGDVTILERIITYNGKPLESIRDGFALLKERAGIDDPEVVPSSIRHTMATWMVKSRVYEWDREIMLGHREPGSKTTANYVHLDPDFLKDATAAIDAYFEQLQPMVKRPLRTSSAPLRGLRPVNLED